MGKYKQWLHHQEIGRRLRDQINTLEQERGRVQQMAPTHPTSLPELENPIVAALQNYTRQGNRLSDIDVIKAAMPALGAPPDQRQPVPSAATPSTPITASVPVVSAAAPADAGVVASLLARAEQMPSDPLEQMRDLSHARAEEPAAATASSVTGTSPAADSVSGWWQRQRAADDD